MKYLFIGDSITDAKRNRNDPDSLGNGYVALASQQLPQGSMVMNRGMSGHTSKEVMKRWEKDCILLQPDFVTLLVGINDALLHSRFACFGKTADFAGNCNQMLSRLQNSLPNTKVVLMEPFLLPLNSKQNKMLGDVADKRMATRELAKQYGAGFVKLQEVFSQAAEQAPADHFTTDGIHPTEKGHALIAAVWLETVKRFK